MRSAANPHSDEAGTQSVKTELCLNHLLGIGLSAIPIACYPYYVDQFTPAKWGFLYFVSFIQLLLFIYSKKLVLLPRSRILVYLAGALISLYVLSVIINLPGAYENQFLDWACFFSIFLISYNSNFRSSKFMEILVAHNFVGTISVLAYGFLQAFNFDPFPALQGNEFPSSFFGFQNMTAEFIGLSILIQIYSLFKMESGFKRRSFLLTLPVLVASLIYLKTLECRSVFLSLLVSTVPLLFSRRSVKIRLSAIGFLTLVSLMILPHIYKPLNIWPNIVNSPTLGDQKNSDQLHQIKSSNSSLRLVRWLNTLHMIQNNPWGVGPGNFEFSYLPFSKAYQRDLEISENTLVKAPHNGYLQAAAQSGIPFSILLTISFILFGYKLYRKLNLESPFKKELTLSASISIFLLIDGFFAFPMDNAYPFYLIAVTIGFTLRMLCNRTYLVQKSLSNIGLTILAIAIGSTTLAFNFSKYVEGLYEEDTTLDLSNAMKISCLLFPSNWHNCISFGDLAIKSGQYKEAELVALKLLNANHSHFPAMRILAFSLFNQGDFIGGCRELKRYDSLFANQSSLHLPYVNFCSDHRSSLSRSSSLDDSTLDP